VSAARPRWRAKNRAELSRSYSGTGWCRPDYADVRIMPTLVVSSLVAGVAELPKSA
jgi:hypothetical protein